MSSKEFGAYLVGNEILRLFVFKFSKSDRKCQRFSSFKAQQVGKSGDKINNAM
jgi:hypothetical protein